MTNSSGYYGSWGGQTLPTNAYWQNLYDEKAERGLCYYDATHTLTSYALYELPLGRDKKIGNNWNRAVDSVLGHWQLSGILSLHSGFPLDLEGNDVSGTHSRGARADCNGQPAKVYGRQNSPKGGFQWFDPSPFSQPLPGTFGSCGVTVVRGPGLHNLDLGIEKQIPITEKKYIQIRSEFLNFTNTPILNSPTMFLGSDLGRLTSSQGARNIQFGFKLYY